MSNREPTLMDALCSWHYVGWTTPFLEGVMRGTFWASIITWPVVVAVLVMG
jgi:hypothetical protein